MNEEEKAGVGAGAPTLLFATHASGVLYLGKGNLHTVVVAGDGAQAQVDFYDGVSTGGRFLFRVNTGVDNTVTLAFIVPILLSIGLYVAVQAVTDYVSVQMSGV